MSSFYVMLIVNILAVAAFLYIRVQKGGVYGLLSKIIASIAFMCLGFVGLNLLGTFQSFAMLIMIGLLFGLVGDVVLDLKVIYPESNALYLNSGMISFGLGHIVYFVAIISAVSFLNPNYSLTAPILVSLAITIPISVAIMFASKFLNIKFGNFIAHAIIYTVLLTFMVVFTIYLATEFKPMGILAAGFVLFLLSDLVLSTMYFGGKPHDKVLIVANHTLYYAAQICIASFLFFV